MNDYLGKFIELEELWNKLFYWILVDFFLVLEMIEELVINISDLEIFIFYIFGLNSDDGLWWVLGKKSLYLKMFYKFVVS